MNTYRGDEKLRNFTWELITPPDYTDNQSLSRRKKSKKGQNQPMQAIEWIADEKYDMEANLDKNYRKHLDRHNNKVLLRIKMMHSIQYEILGPAMDKLHNRSLPFK